MGRTAKTISVSIMPETLTLLEQLAKAQHSSRSKYITDLIWNAAKEVENDGKHEFFKINKQ